MLQYKHDYRLANKAYSLLDAARRLMAVECFEDALVPIVDARIALDKYLSRDNVCPIECEENGWVKMDDALQLTFTREQLDCIRWYLGERLKEFPSNELALELLGIINRCQELLGCPCFDSVREFVSNDLGNWTIISSRV